MVIPAPRVLEEAPTRGLEHVRCVVTLKWERADGSSGGSSGGSGGGHVKIRLLQMLKLKRAATAGCSILHAAGDFREITAHRPTSRSCARTCCCCYCTVVRTSSANVVTTTAIPVSRIVFVVTTSDHLLLLAKIRLLLLRSAAVPVREPQAQ